MEIKTETSKTYWVGMTEDQARDMLDLSIKSRQEPGHEWAGANLKGTYVPVEPSQLETLDALRIAFLASGLQRTQD